MFLKQTIGTYRQEFKRHHKRMKRDEKRQYVCEIHHMSAFQVLTHKQYISSQSVKGKAPLIRTGKSLTMFITDIQEQLKSTRCWRQAGQARRRPPGRMRSGTRSGFWALKATKGQQWFWYTCWASGNWTPSVGGGKKTTHSQLSKEARKPKP